MRISDGEAGGRAVREARRGGGPTSPASAPSTPPSSVGRSAVEDLPRRNLRRHRRRRPPSGASLGKEESAWEGRGIGGKQRCGMVPSVWSGDKVGPPSFFLLFSEKIGGNLPLLGWIGPLCCVAFDTLNTIMHISNNNYTILYLLAISAYPCFWKVSYQHIGIDVSVSRIGAT
jgi:hypothetical protein